MEKAPSSRPMDYMQASAELHRMAAQYGTHAPEPNPRQFPDEFSTPGASRQWPTHMDGQGQFGSTPVVPPPFMPAYDYSFATYNSPGMESSPATPGPAVVEAYRELNNKAAVINQQRIAAQRERDRLRAELDLFIKQEGIQRGAQAQAAELEELQARQVRDHERDEVKRRKEELRRQMKQYDELRKAEEAANGRYRDAKRETKQLHKMLQELQAQSSHLERSLKASTEQVQRLQRQLGEDRQNRAKEDEALRQKINELQQAIQTEMHSRNELVEKARRDEENLANLATTAREAISLSQPQHQARPVGGQQQNQRQAAEVTEQFEEVLELTRDSIRSLIEHADDVLAAVKHVSHTDRQQSSRKAPRHSQATQTAMRQKSRAATVEAIPPHVSSASGSQQSYSSTGEPLQDHAFYEFSHSQSEHGTDASDDAAMLEHIEEMIPRYGNDDYDDDGEDEFAYEYSDGQQYAYNRGLRQPPSKDRSHTKRRPRPCERWAAPPIRKVLPASEPAPVPFIPSTSGKSFNLIGNLSEAARDLRISYPPHMLHGNENGHTNKPFHRTYPKMRGTVDPSFQGEVEQLLLVELEDLEDRLEHLRNTSRDKSLIAALQDRIAYTREQLLGISDSEHDFRHRSPERQRNTAVLHALQDRRYYRQHTRAPPV